MKIRVRVIKLAIFTVLLAIFLSGCEGGDGDTIQGKGIIQGVVRDATTQNPIENAGVSVQGTNLKTNTNAQGQYIIQDVPEGKRTIIATATGYTSQSKSVNVTANTTTTVDFSLTPSSAGGDTYYVSTTGDDSNPGTESQPWRTIQHAAETIVAGDTVYVKAGTYQERVTPQNSGSAGNYIIYAVYPGDTVAIDGNGVSVPEWGGLFDVSGKSYIKISTFRVINSTGAGILADTSSHIIIEKNYTYNTTSSGIGIWDSDNIVIDDNEVELACNDGEQECITVAGTDTFEVKNNNVHHGGPGTLGGEGIDVKDGSSNGTVHNNYVHHLQRLGIYVDAWDKHTYNIEVFKNIVHDCAADGFTVASEAGGLLENIRVYNNIAYNNKYVGITIAGYGEPGVEKHPMKDIKVINNTFYNNGSGDWGGGISVENPDVENLIIRNNICSQNLLFQIQVEISGQNLTVDHNLIDGYRGYPDEIYGDDYVEGNPKFVNPTAADFHLQKDSPAIDKGSSIEAPDDDFDGNSRPQGAEYDIGAFEYGSSSASKEKGGEGYEN